MEQVEQTERTKLGVSIRAREQTMAVSFWSKCLQQLNVYDATCDAQHLLGDLDCGWCWFWIGVVARGAQHLMFNVSQAYTLTIENATLNLDEESSHLTIQD